MQRNKNYYTYITSLRMQLPKFISPLESYQTRNKNNLNIGCADNVIFTCVAVYIFCTMYIT